MKFMLVAVLLAVAVCSAYSIPVFDEMVNLEDLEQYETREEGGVRQRRVTCDLLSIGGKISLGDSACAANCLSMGKAGGSCHGGICQCRKTTFGELWDKRFG